MLSLPHEGEARKPHSPRQDKARECDGDLLAWCHVVTLLG